MAAEVASRRLWMWLLAFGLAGVPAFVFRLSGAHPEPVAAAFIFGIGIVGGAFIITWAASAAQVDISASLAIAVLALIAILPEYAIEAVLAWDAGASYNPALGQVTVEMQRVAANVTGSNRLLIGLGWSLVVLIFWFKPRRTLDLRGFMGLELGMLVAATLATLSIFFMHQVHLVLAAVLIAMYLFYLWVTSTSETGEPELMGVSLLIGTLPTLRRRVRGVSPCTSSPLLLWPSGFPLPRE